jgi:hypothetical protein
MLEASLKDSNLSDAEKKAIRAQAQAEGMAAGLGATAAAVAAHQQTKREADIAWLEQAEETEQDRHAKHINSDEYKAYQAGLLTWHQEQARLAPIPGKGPGLASLVSSNETPDETSSIWRFLREYDGEGSLEFRVDTPLAVVSPTSTPHNFKGLSIVQVAKDMFDNQTNTNALPEYFYNFPFPNTHCTEFVAEVQRRAGLAIPAINNPNNPVSFRTPNNQRYNSEINGEFRFRLNPLYHPADLDDPQQVNRAIYDFYKNNPSIFVPGATVYTKSSDLFIVYGSGDTIAKDRYLLDTGVFGHSAILGDQFGTNGPVIYEMSGPYSYNQSGGAYTGIWAGDWRYQWSTVQGQEHAITSRSLFDFNAPTKTIINGNPDGETTATIYLTELSVVPAQPVMPIDLSNYGLNFEIGSNTQSNITEIVDQSTGEKITKVCYLNPETENSLIQQLYCPPWGQP